MNENKSQQLIEILKIGILAYLVFLIFKTAKSLTNVAGDILEDESTEISDDEISNTGEKLSYPISQYSVFADGLEEAFTNNGFGTNEEKIFNIFKKMKNKADVMKLIQAFGKRNLFTLSGGVVIGHNLPWYISSELNEDEISELNSILKSNNINYSF